jgi:hypothetical protein
LTWSTWFWRAGGGGSPGEDGPGLAGGRKACPSSPGGAGPHRRSWREGLFKVRAGLLS